MKKYYSSVMAILMIFSYQIQGQTKPKNIPRETRYSEFTLDKVIYQLWVLEKKNNTNKIKVAWNKDGSLDYVVLNVGPYEYRSKYFPKISNTTKFAFGGQDCYFKTFYDEAYSIPYGLHLDYHEYGGTVKRKSCKMLKLATIDRTDHISTPEFPYGKETDFCGEELHYDKQGNIIKRIQHKKCDNECGFFMPFLTPGEYKMRSKTNVRENPDIKSTSIRMLNPGDKIKVVKDTHLMQTLYGTTAPWLEIQMDDGKKGYIFGGLIDIENLWVNVEGFDFRELLNTKFIDKQPQYCFEDK
jgi:hypothetical protein